MCQNWSSSERSFNIVYQILYGTCQKKVNLSYLTTKVLGWLSLYRRSPTDMGILIFLKLLSLDKYNNGVNLIWASDTNTVKIFHTDIQRWRRNFPQLQNSNRVGLKSLSIYLEILKRRGGGGVGKRYRQKRQEEEPVYCACTHLSFSLQ